jgi:hypothetical protein
MYVLGVGRRINVKMSFIDDKINISREMLGFSPPDSRNKRFKKNPKREASARIDLSAAMDKAKQPHARDSVERQIAGTCGTAGI